VAREQACRSDVLYFSGYSRPHPACTSASITAFNDKRLLHYLPVVVFGYMHLVYYRRAVSSFTLL